MAIHLICKTPSAERAAELLTRKLSNRGVSVSEAGECVSLEICGDNTWEGFDIKQIDNGLALSSGTLIGLIHAAGWLLKHLHYGKTPILPDQDVHENPSCSVRGAYLAAHVDNWYEIAPIPEVLEYVEDLVLDGFNYLLVCPPTGFCETPDDPRIVPGYQKIRTLYTFAHEIGMKTVMFAGGNSAFKSETKGMEPEPVFDPFGHRGSFGNKVCPSKPGAMELLRRNTERTLDHMEGIPVDMVVAWPYDEGGCGCSQCTPWGSNGFMRVTRQAFEQVRKRYPNITRTISTWCFDMPDEGEFENLYRAAGEEGWIDCILCDSPEEYAEYPLTHPLPEGVSLINFPEISMWGMWPWAGWGTNPIPERLVGLWHDIRDIANGGLYYSEGPYTDVNSSIIASLYWQRDPDIDQVLLDYAQTYFGLENAQDFVKLVHNIEKTQTDVQTTGKTDLRIIDETFALAQKLESQLPAWAKTTMRWRFVYLRTMLDTRRYHLAATLSDEEVAAHSINPAAALKSHDTSPGWIFLDWKTLLADDEIAQEGLQELVRIQYCHPEDRGDLMHSRVRPACK